MKKFWRTVSRASGRERKDAVKAEMGKPGKPVPVDRFVTIPPSTFRHNMKEARTMSFFSDIALEVADGRRFLVHKIVLAARTKSFLSKTDFEKDRVKVPVSRLALSKFLDLVYYGEVSLVRLKNNSHARAQFLDLCQPELSDMNFSLLKTAAQRSSPNNHWRMSIEDVVFDYEKILGSRDHYDCKIQSDDGFLRAHKILLVVRCELFRTRWVLKGGSGQDGPSSPRRTKKNRAGETVIDPSIFDMSTLPQKFVGELVRFCYCDYVKLNRDVAPVFLDKAKAVNIPRLLATVEHFSAQQLTKMSVGRTLQLAVENEAAQLAAACLSYLDKNQQYMEEKVDVSYVPPKYRKSDPGPRSAREGVDYESEEMSWIDASSELELDLSLSVSEEVSTSYADSLSFETESSSMISTDDLDSLPKSYSESSSSDEL